MYLFRVRSLVLALVCMALAPVPLAFAKSTDETVDADTQACMQANDNVACEAVYDYLREKIDDAKGKAGQALLPELRRVAETGCAAGNGWLCNTIGYAHGQGEDGWAQDRAQSLDYYLKACETGYGIGCGNAGVAFELGRAVAEDQAEAERLYRKGCGFGSMGSCQYLASWLLDDRVYAEPAATETIAEMKANCADMALNGPSCVALGVAYFRGSAGVSANENEAGRYWSKACREIRYAPACYYVGLKVLRDDTIEDKTAPIIIAGVQSVMAACRFGLTEACEYAAPALVESAFNYQQSMTDARYQICVQKPNLEDCAFAGNAYATATFLSRDSPTGVYRDFGKAALAWLTACRTFDSHCVDAADMHLKKLDFALPAPNLAIGILETACGKGNQEACARHDSLVDETGGVNGSYIDPMVSDDERFILAKFDIEAGNVDRGRETLQSLASLGHTDAQLELALLYEAGLSVAPLVDGRSTYIPLFDRDEMKWELFERVAAKGVPDAAMRVAVHAYEENDHEGGDSYENAIARALSLGAEGSEEFYRAVIAQDKARMDARHEALVALNRRNVEARDKMDRETVQRAWDQYAQRQKEAEERAGGRVCGTVYGQGNSTYRTCMTRDHAAKYYRGNF
ncbi:tetratricopeptide repeat protein [Hyphomonas johnsonii]|uniref:Sel1 domain-containing protein n=1 Tax=Hyphomonas johnsonii MHS-2 TaxID=1280950 RepID=A0A059FTP7_9PROT|nr:tetratricopeptide repeat protein [Hyphomonas johnsonii]KCZ94040.1 Sel1 domain-containing protein [Hyphomonas johnsonii MHS-2]